MEVDQQQAWKSPLLAKAKQFKAAFGTTQGEEVLKALSDAFEKQQLMGSDPYETAYNVGQRDVVVYINQLVDLDLAKLEKTKVKT